MALWLLKTLFYFFNYFVFCVAEENERVQIRVYHGSDDLFQNYAPWGYFVRQPVDNRRSNYHNGYKQHADHWN